MDHPYKHADYPFNLIYLNYESCSWKTQAREGRFVEAIKELRWQEGRNGENVLGLKVAKDTVEAYVNHYRTVQPKMEPIRINDRVSLHVTPDDGGGYNVQMVTTIAAGHAHTVNELMHMVARITAQNK